MADILDEVLSDEKDENKILLFRKVLPIIIVTTIIIAISIASYSWYQHKTTDYNRKIGDEFVELILEPGEADAAILSLEALVNDSQNRQIELAELKIVSTLIAANNVAAAMEKLETIINNTKYYDITTSFARLVWISRVLDADKMSEEVHTKAIAYLQYFTNKDQPFFATATLLKALFYKKHDQNDLATKYAAIILESKDASLILKEQARAILASM